MRWPVLTVVIGLRSLVAAAIRLCSDASLKALFSIEELEVASKLTEIQAERFTSMSASLSPDRLARICGLDGETDDAIGRARMLTKALRESARQTASQSLLACHLIEKNVSGRAYLEAAEAEQKEPVLCLAR